MNNWGTYKLADLGTLARGKSKHRPRDAPFLYGGIYPFIQTGDVKSANHRIKKHTQTYSEDGLKQSKLWPKGTICITIAANIADTAILNYPACFPDSVIGFIADSNKCDVDFMEYLLQYTKKNIQSHAIGSVQDNINLKTFENIELKVPDLPTQKQIGEMLCSLEDKIDLNVRMNQTLENMAQVIFKEWFVDFNFPRFEGELVDGLPEGWKMGKIDDICEVTDYVANGSFAALAENVKYRNEPDFAILVRLTDYNRNFSGDLVYVNEQSYNFLSKSKLFGDEIIIANVGTVGNVFRAPFLNRPMTLGPNAIMIKNSDYSHFLYCYFVSELGQHAIKGIVAGSVQPKFNKTDFRKLPIVLPSEDILKEFNEMYSSLNEKILANKAQILSLRQLLDNLLPQLMSGKIEINP